MNKKFRIVLASVLAVAISGVYYAIPAKAAMLTQAKVTLSNPKQSDASNYTFNVTPGSSATIKGIKMEFLKAPSGSSQYPTNIGFGSATLNATIVGIDGTWELDKTTDAASGIIYLTNATGTAVTSSTPLQWSVDGITNPDINVANTGCNPNQTNASAGSCFIKITTFTTEVVATMRAGTSAQDSNTIGFAIYKGASMTATVDPSLAFTVVGVNSGAAVNAAAGVSTASATSAFDSLPFGNLTVGTPKVLGHLLYVKTNANNGYTVKVKSTTDLATDAAGILKGVYAGNNIDGFANDGGTAATWVAPQTWASPTSTTANTNSGYIGVNSNNANTVFTGGNATKWAPMQNMTANTVMSSSGPDLGTAATTVSFAIEANVYQPADSYTGTFVYNCVPVY